MQVSLLKFIFLAASVQSVASWSSYPDSEAEVDEPTSDLSGLADGAVGVERALRGESARNRKLEEDSEELKKRLLHTERYKTMLHSRDQLSKRASAALVRQYENKYQTALSKYADGARNLKKGYHQCISNKAKLKRTLVETKGYLASERNWRVTAEDTIFHLRLEDRHLQELVANVTASELVDRKRDWTLEQEVAQQTQKVQGYQEDVGNLIKQIQDDSKADGATKIKLQDAERVKDQLAKELNFEVNGMAKKTTDFRVRELTWAHEADILDGQLKKEHERIATAEKNTTAAIHNFVIAAGMRASVNAESAKAKEKLAAAVKQIDATKPQVTEAQKMLDSVKAQLMRQQKLERHEHAESAAYASRAGSVVQANAQIAVAKGKIVKLEEEKKEDDAEMNTWKQRAEALDASLAAMQRLEAEVGISRKELADRKRQLEETNSTKAQLAAVTARAEQEQKRLSEEKARLAKAAVSAQVVQAAKSKVREESEELSATKQRLSAAVEESQSLTNARKALEVELEAATVEKKKAVAAQAELDAEKAKEHVMSLKLQNLKLEASKVQRKGQLENMEKLQREAAKRQQELKASHATRQALLKNLTTAKAELTATKAHLNDTQAMKNREASHYGTRLAALKNENTQISKDLEIVHRAEAALSKDIAAQKAALQQLKSAQEAESVITQGAQKDQLSEMREATANATKHARELQEQAVEARDLIAKDASLISRCLNHTKSIKEELEENFESQRLAFEKDVGSKYKALAQQLQGTRHEQEGLLSENKGLVAMVDKLRLQLLEAKKRR